MNFKDIKRAIGNLIRLKDPRLLEIIDYKEYDFSGVNFEDVLLALKDFKYNRTYFMERRLKKNEIWQDWNGDMINTSLVWIQRIKAKVPYFLIYDDKLYTKWTRINDEKLAKFLIESDSILSERTMLDLVNEGMGFNE